MNRHLKMATRMLVARIKDNEINQEADGLTNNHAIRFTITHHIQTTPYHDQAQWGAVVRYLRRPSQVRGIRGRQHTNQEVQDFLTGVDLLYAS
jgi:hypothetical protein